MFSKKDDSKRRRYLKELDSGFNFLTHKRLTSGQKAYRHCYLDGKKFVPSKGYKDHAKDICDKHPSSPYYYERNPRYFKSEKERTDAYNRHRRLDDLAKTHLDEVKAMYHYLVRDVIEEEGRDPRPEELRYIYDFCKYRYSRNK